MSFSTPHKQVAVIPNLYVKGLSTQFLLMPSSFFIFLPVKDITMSELTVSKKIKQLPPEAKRQVQDFIDFLYQRYSLKESSKKPKVSNLSDSPFFGIWKDRDEMADSTEWVKNVRKSQWSRK
jgi:hypothetical protein